MEDLNPCQECYPKT